MQRLTTTLYRFLTIALVAVSLHLGIATAGFAQPCPPEVEAIPRGPITPNFSAIISQCPEACPNYAPGEFQSYSLGTAGLDFIEIKCTDLTQKITKIYSTIQPDSTASTCWNCVGGCGLNCPPGELCMPVPWSSGSDCQRFGCPAGYTIAERDAVAGGGKEPYCVLTDPSQQCPIPPGPPPITVKLEGPATIRTGEMCTWTANAFGGATGVAKTYTWYEENNPVGTGQYYTGGRPSGTLVGSSWRLRVTATDGVRYGSYEIRAREDANGAICMQ